MKRIYKSYLKSVLQETGQNHLTFRALIRFSILNKTDDSTSNSLEIKFQKALAIDAYSDPTRVNKVFLNWKKGKSLQQTELKDRLEIEKEAATLMHEVTQAPLNKQMLKDLYHMCMEMMNRYNKHEKRDTFNIILNFVKINRKSMPPQDPQGNQIITSTARIKKNFSFSSAKGDKKPILTTKEKGSIHHSLHRESKTNSEHEFATETLLDYPTSVSQSSNKSKHKKSLPGPTGPPGAFPIDFSNGFMGFNNKIDRFEKVYGVKADKNLTELG